MNTVKSGFPSQKKFKIAGRTGSIKLYDGLNPEFIQYIRTIKTSAPPDFTIELRKSNEPAFNLEIKSASLAVFNISTTQVLPGYGFMTIFKALLQGMLLDIGIFLFHGLHDGYGNVSINGSETGWYDRQIIAPTKYERLVVIKNESKGLFIYRDFLLSERGGHRIRLKSINPVKKNQALSQEFLLNSTWFYFFFSHFFEKHRVDFLPEKMAKKLEDGLIVFENAL